MEMMNQEHINAVTNMQCYIKSNLSKKISLNDLAKVSGYSPWYSSKIFKSYTKKTPFEYIRAMRLSEAALLFRDEKNKVIDVAFDFYFNSHEGFTRAFSKQFGINPKTYMKQKPPIKLFLPHPISDYYKMLMKGEVKMQSNELSTIFSQVVEKPERKLILKRGVKATEYFEYCEEVSCDVWGILSSINNAISEPMGLWLSDSLINPNTSKYVQGVEVPVDYDGVIPEGFDLINLKACKIMIFQGQSYDDKNFEEAVVNVQSAISKYNPTVYGFKWADEDGPRFQLEPQGARGYIEGRPVKFVK